MVSHTSFFSPFWCHHQCTNIRTNFLSSCHLAEEKLPCTVWVVALNQMNAWTIWCISLVLCAEPPLAGLKHGRESNPNRRDKLTGIYDVLELESPVLLSVFCAHSVRWRSRTAWMCPTRAKSTRNTCVRNVKSWVTTAAACNKRLPSLWSERQERFTSHPPLHRPSNLVTVSRDDIQEKPEEYICVNQLLVQESPLKHFLIRLMLQS